MKYEFKILLDSFKDYLRALAGIAFDFWYIVPFITFALVVIIIFDRWKEHKLSRSSIHDIDTKEVGDFKGHLTNIFVRLGYQIEFTNHKDDHELNMVAVKDGVKTMIRAVRNQGKIGWKPIQESLNAMSFHECKALIMVTNKYFTVRSKDFAAENGVVLWDRDALIKNLLDTKEDSAFELEASEADLSGNEFIKTKHVLSIDEFLAKKGDE